MAKRYLHHIVFENILNRIKTGVYKPETKIPKTTELAHELGTSSVTIDKALSALVDLGYLTRKARSGSFVTPRSQWPQDGGGNIGSLTLYCLVMRDTLSPYFWKGAVKGIHDAARTQNSYMLPCYLDDDPDSAREAVADLGIKGIKGIVFAPLDRRTEKDYEEFNGSIVDTILNQKIPLVLVDRFLRSRDLSHVISRDYEAAVQLTEGLFASGARKPIFFTHLYNTTFASRVQGFRDVMKSQGFGEADIDSRIIEICPEEVVFNPGDVQSFIELFKNLPGYDGIFTVNAATFYACVNTFSLSGTLSSGNIKFVTFDDVVPVNIPGLLMSAVQESYRIGKLAGTILTDMIPRWPDTTFHLKKDYHIKYFEI